MSTIDLKNKTILVTGAAGFIGSNLVKRIYEEVPSATVIGIDNMNTYYDVALKEFRLNELDKYSTFTFVNGNIADKALITDLFEKYKPAVVVNLAAQAGVRYSITNPDAYVESNLVGFFNILEACRILMTTDRQEWSIWCMLLLPVFMVQTKRFRTVQMIRWITPYLCMQPPRNLMS